MFKTFHLIVGPWLRKSLHTERISQFFTETVINTEDFILILPLTAVKRILSKIQDAYIRLTADDLHLVGNIQCTAALLCLTRRTKLTILFSCTSRLQPEKKTVMVKHTPFQNSVPFMVLCIYRIDLTGHGIVHRYLPCSADTDTKLFFSWKILVFLALLQFIDHDTGIGNLLCAVYMAQEQPAVFSLFSHLVDQVCGRFTIILKYLDISCTFHSFQQTVLAECHSLTLICQLRTSV